MVLMFIFFNSHHGFCINKNIKTFEFLNDFPNILKPLNQIERKFPKKTDRDLSFDNYLCYDFTRHETKNELMKIAVGDAKSPALRQCVQPSDQDKAGD
jgi:hypothetical protein